MDQKNSNKTILFIFCVILGIMIVTQTKYISKENLNISDREKGYLNKINEAKKDNEKIHEQIELTRQKVSDYENDASKYDDRLKAISDELTVYKIFSGFETVEGPGIILKIDKLKYDENINSVIFNYKYILDIISYLNIAEAEAISINGVRYTWHTEIIRGYNVLVMDDTIINGPVEIKAIGNPYKMKSALEFKGGLVDVLRKGFNMNVEVIEMDNIIIEPSKAIKDFKNIKTKKSS